MSVLALATLSIPAAQASSSGAETDRIRTASGGHARLVGPAPDSTRYLQAAARCTSARRGLAFYRGRYSTHVGVRGVHVEWPPGRKPRSCADARYLAKVWRSRSFAERQETERWQHDLRWNVSFAINYVFGEYAGQAHRVVSCESGHSTTATNGQYLGLFQMGSSERATYGHGSSPLEQARAAYRYFVASGRDWSPWQCRPWGLAW